MDALTEIEKIETSVQFRGVDLAAVLQEAALYAASFEGPPWSVSVEETTIWDDDGEYYHDAWLLTIERYGLN